MKTIETEKTIKVTEYVAFTGEIFEDKEECRRFEEDAKEHAEQYIKANCLKSFDGDCVSFLHACGYGSNNYIVRVDDAMHFNLLAVFMTGYTNKEDDEIIDALNGALALNKVVWVEEYTGDWYYYGDYLECLNSVRKTLDKAVFNV